MDVLLGYAFICRKCSEEFYRECCVNSLRNDVTNRSDRVRMLNILRREATAEQVSLSTSPTLTTDDDSADKSDESNASDSFSTRLYNGDVMDLTLDALHVLCQIVASFGVTKYNKLTSTVTENKEPRTVPRYTSTSQVAASTQTHLCSLQLPCGPQLMIVLLEDLAALVSSSENTFRALNEIRTLIVAGQTELNSQHPNESRITRRQLLKTDQKLVFLLACFNPKDPVAMHWQSSIQPPMNVLVSSVLCMHLTTFKTHDQLPVRPVAGPNWRKMIRENVGAQTQESPLITECRTNE
ncbi:hypothetical protein EG68_11931 [Paragonimus skrjabini miyazakii]|uniref:Uncharacterized protein n=1 Tax=Paragonimus skrjabini miyazakii TaxID=59628 RepID=A0A8S9YGZ7_9TREM|nr:hypothetical protein EG68_11931 [Paragonimus skrjabini miyazakii]